MDTNKQELLPPAIRLAMQIPKEYDDELAQTKYVNGYLLGVIGALYEESATVREFINRKLGDV